MRSGFLGRGIGPVALKRRRAAAADWWQVAGQTCVAAYKAIGAASLAASYVNLANPGTYDAAPGVAPTLAAGGWSFAAASSQYLATSVITSTTAYTLIVRYSDAAPRAGMLAGGRVSSARYVIAPNWSDNNMYLGNGNTFISVGAGAASGVIAISGVYGYLNGSQITASLPANFATNAEIWIGAHNYTTPSYITATIAAVAIYSTTLSAADVAALTTRMQALT